MAVKLTKAEAHYQGRPQGTEHCAACTMFRAPYGCTAVQGDVSPRGWCRRYDPTQQAAMARDARELRTQLAAAAKATERAPTDAQKEAGNYAKGDVKLDGLDIKIENPKGSARSGVGPNGRRWRCTLPAHYGYIRGTTGHDGDAVDVYLGPAHASGKVFVVDQVDAKTGAFDEHKAMLCYATQAAALADYKRAFSDGKGGRRIGAVTELSQEAFKDWVTAGPTRKPLGQLRRRFADGGEVTPLRSGYTGGAGFRGELDPESEIAGAFDLPLSRPAGEEFALSRRVPYWRDLDALYRDLGLKPAPAGGYDWNLPRSQEHADGGPALDDVVRLPPGEFPETALRPPGPIDQNGREVEFTNTETNRALELLRWLAKHLGGAWENKFMGMGYTGGPRSAVKMPLNAARELAPRPPPSIPARKELGYQDGGVMDSTRSFANWGRVK